MATYQIVSLGELLVEIMRTRVDSPLDRPGDFIGPFPSGAPAIFADQAARLANACGALGATRKGPMEGAATRTKAFKLANLTDGDR